MLALGAKGVISTVANVAPRRTVEMVEAFRRGDLMRAQQLHYELAPLVRALFLETNPIPVKTAYKIMGLAAGPLRLPLAPMSAENEDKLKEVLKDLGEFS
jgi:4-hydroxy-tetrahydrodipicolinate synthase